MALPQWEYKTVKTEAGGWLGGVVDTQGLDSQLNALGRDGWELVAAFDTNMLAHGATREVVAVFKRPAP